MAVFEQYTPGLGSVGNYQVAGTPWMTGSLIAASGNTAGLNSSTKAIQFSYVTKEVTVMNLGDTDLHIHLANNAGAYGNALGSHMYTLPPSGTTTAALCRQTFDMKTKELYISNAGSGIGSFQVYASLTRIPRARMFVLTGSGADSEAGDGTITP